MKSGYIAVNVTVVLQYVLIFFVKKICPTPSSLGLIVQESFILPSKEEGIMSRKKQKM
jgi:hypothetical protein